MADQRVLFESTAVRLKIRQGRSNRLNSQIFPGGFEGGNEPVFGLFV
jgi:hypothetical protein